MKYRLHLGEIEDYEDLLEELPELVDLDSIILTKDKLQINKLDFNRVYCNLSEWNTYEEDEPFWWWVYKDCLTEIPETEAEIIIARWIA